MSERTASARDPQGATIISNKNNNLDANTGIGGATLLRDPRRLRERFNYLRGCLAADPPRIFRHLTVGDVEDLLAIAAQLERNALALGEGPREGSK